MTDQIIEAFWKKKPEKEVLETIKYTEPVWTFRNGMALPQMGPPLPRYAGFTPPYQQTPGESEFAPIPNYSITPDMSPEVVLNSADGILHIESSARKQAIFKPSIIKRLEDLLDDEEWLHTQPSAEQAKRQIEKKIRQLKGTCLEDEIEGLIK